MAQRGQTEAPAVDRPDSSGSATYSSLPRTAATTGPGRSEQRVEHVLLDLSTFLQPLQLLLG